jgi:hypothetical protein
MQTMTALSKFPDLNVNNFGQWLRLAQMQHHFSIRGDWDEPRLVIPDETVSAALAWLMHPHTSVKDKADFVYEHIIKECCDENLALLFDALATGNLMPLCREYVEDLILAGGHFNALCEAEFGPRSDEL